MTKKNSAGFSIGTFIVLSLFISLTSASASSFQSNAQSQTKATYLLIRRAALSPFPVTCGMLKVSGSITWYPGPNYWSSSTNNVWVDINGWLHIQITKTNGAWYCVNLKTVQTLGYGTYSFVVSKTLQAWTKMWCWSFLLMDDAHEVDAEFSIWATILHGTQFSLRRSL